MAAIAATLVVAGSGAWAAANRPANDAAARQLLIALEAGPGGGEWQALARVFPRQILALTGDISVASRKPGANPAAIRQELRARVTALVQSGAEDMPRASNQTLRVYAASQAELLDALNAESAANCGFMALRGGLPPGSHTAATTKAASDMLIAQLDMIESGRAHPVERPEITVDELRFVFQSAEDAGFDKVALEALFRGDLASLTPGAACDATRALMRTALRVPPDLAGRYIAHLLAKIGSATGGSTARRDTETMLASMETLADIGPALKRFEAAYPEEVGPLSARMTQAFRDGRSNASDTVMLRVAELLRSNRAAASAPDDSLIQFAHAQADYLQDFFQRDPQRCGERMAETGTAHEGVSDVNGKSAAVSAALFDVLSGARKSPTARGPVTAEDVQAIRAAMKSAGAPDDAPKAALDGKIATLPPAERCWVAAAMWRAATQAPADVGGRVVAALMTPPTT
jgi:hypothetical protein